MRASARRRLPPVLRPLPSATLKCAFAMAAFLFARKSKRMIRKRRPRWRRKVLSPAFPRLASAPREFKERQLHLFETQSAPAGNIDRRKIFLRDDVHVHMKHKVVRLGVHVG